MTTLAAPLPRPAPRLWTDAPAFTALALLLTLAMVPMLAAMALDPREFGGEDIWLKPLKFHVALAIYLLTLAFFARWMTEAQRSGRAWRWFVAVVCACVLGELVWIGGAAALGTGSHFNVSTPLWNAIYGLMGFFAAFLTSASFVMAVAIHRNAATGLEPALKLSLVLGLGLTLPLTLIVAFTMAAGTGHLVGTPITDARLPLMGWSREVGDLRVSHFIATHALHVVPLVGWLVAGRLPDRAARAAVILAALAWVGLTFATFAQALMGKPVI